MNLVSRVNTLERMSAAQKKAAWHEAYRTPTPPAFGTGLMSRAIAHRWQEKMAGGLSSAELHQLASLAVKGEKLRAGKIISTIKPGTWLSRTWHGEVHQLVVLDKG